MHFHFSFYSSILLIFFTHGLLFSMLLAKKALAQNERANFWLAGFTFVCTLNIVPWMMGHAGWYSLQPYRDILFYFPFQNFFLLGPLIFFYTKALLNPGFQLRKRDALHFLPAVLYLLYTFIMFVVDKLILHRYFFYADGHDRDLDTWYRLAGIASISFHLFLSLRYYSVYKSLAAQLVSFADAVLFRWMKRYLLALLLMQILDVAFFCLYPAWGNFTGKWWYYFVFSGLFYYVAFTAYSNRVQPLFSFRLIGEEKYGLLVSQVPKVIAFTPLLLLKDGKEEVIDTSAHVDDVSASLEIEIQRWKVKVLKAMMDDEVYKEPELTLTDLARQLQTNASVLSRIVNKGFGVSFNDFINGYRVAAMKKRLAAGEHKQQTLLSLALDCGFNSKTTFNRVFKKHTGLSPKHYIRQLHPVGKHSAAAREKYDVPYYDLERPLPAGLPSSPEINSV